MTFDEYQKKSPLTALYPDIRERFVYPTLGLTNEAGEVAGKVKKIFRDDNGVVTEKKKKELEDELGDVLWYLSQLATDLGLSLEKIANQNLEKLKSRLERGKIGGSGDNR